MKALQKGKLSNNKEYIFVKSSPVKSANVASNSLYQTANQIKNQVGDKSFPSNFMIEKD
ncbi:MAG: hypothetical protein LBG52_06840 [Candidatus Peribacteria bacterium]|jgi:hypothetical protein|nr:hypothetical protein [Candidatus Peribacteria bacterium]